MLGFTASSPLNIDLYEERIRHNGHILVDRLAMEQIYKYEKCRVETLYSLSLRIMQGRSGLYFNQLSKEKVIDYLIECEYVDPKAFKTKKAKGESLNADVLKDIIARGRAKEFLSHYIQYSSLKHKCDRIAKLMDRLDRKAEYRQAGTVLSPLTFHVNQKENMRYNYKDTDLISIPKEYVTSFKAEDDYFLVWGDFAQSDLRIAYNLFIKDDNNIKIMNKYEDKYAGMAAIIADHYGEEFDLDKFRTERELYKVYVLATIYGQTYAATKEGQAFVKRFGEYLDTRPRYVEFRKRIKDRIDLKLMLPIKGYFGSTQPVSFVGNETDVINKSLNTPNQMGTSEIVILTTNAILDMFYERGYTKDEVSIYMVRHDEPILKIHKKAIKDLWILNQASEIQIDDWTPLKLEFEMGYAYKVTDAALMKQFAEVNNDNLDKIVQVAPSGDSTGYMPLPATFFLNVGEVKVPELGKTIVVYYDARRNLADIKAIDTLDDEVISRDINSTVVKAGEFIYDSGYRGAVVENSYTELEYSDSLTFFNFKKTSTTKGQVLAYAWASYAAYKYGQQKGIDLDVDRTSVRANWQVLEKVGSLGVFKD